MLVDSDLVKSIADLYKLKVETVQKLDRFAELSARNLVSAIENSKTPPLNKFITALGIRHVGAQTATALANHFGSIESLSEATKDQLIGIPDIGEVVAESILAYFADEDNLNLLQELKELGINPEKPNLDNAPLKGKSYIVTGTLSSMGREEAEEKLREKGATVTSSVTKTTTALICGEKPGKGKTDKAAKLNIKTIDESEFLKLIS